jgi:hypothetical protein
MRFISSLAALLFLAGTHQAAAFDTFSGGQLSIPSVSMGGATFSNMVVTLGSIVVAPNGTTPNASADSYDPATNRLSVPTVVVGANVYYNVVITVGSLLSVGSVAGADTYNGTYLTIPAVQVVGGPLYSNVVITIGAIVSAGGGMPANARDVYNPSNHQLTVAAVQVASKVYTNAVVTVGSIGSLGGNVTGVAAAGAPIAGSQVNLKDAAGHSASTTTAANGAFSIGVAAMTPPFLLRVTSGLTTLYSYSPGSGIANINPFTSMPLQAYYTTQGTQLGSVFSGTLTPSSFPQASQLALLVQPFVTLLQPYLLNAGLSQPQAFSPFTSPFIANHSGFDQVLDRTVLNSGGMSLTVDNGSGAVAGVVASAVTEQFTAGSPTVLATVAVSSATTNSATSTSSASQQVVPVGINAAQQTALADAQTGVLTMFGNIAQLVAAAHGGNITAGQFAPYIDSNYLDQGVNAAGFAAQLANNFSGAPAGASIAASIVRVNKFDPAAKTLDATVNLVFTSGAMVQGQNYLDDNDNPGYGMVYKQEAGGGWTFYGQQSPFDAHVVLQQTFFYDANNLNPNTPSTNVNMMAQVSTATGALSGASVSGPADSLPDCSQNTPMFTLSQVTLMHDAGSFNGGDRFDLPQCQHSLSGTPPAAGTLYTFSLTETGSGTIVQQPYPLNSLTLDHGDITQFNGISRASFAAGNTVGNVAGTSVTVGFTAPTTFPVLYSNLTGFCQNASQVSGGGGTDFSSSNNLTPAVTSGTLVIPAMCSGATMKTLNIGVSFVGIDGETAQVQQQLHD